MTSVYGIAVIGASSGGLAALRTLVLSLPTDLSIPVVVVQHRHRESGRALQDLLQDQTTLPVCEVEDKAAIEPGKVFVAPADYHLLVERDSFVLSVDEPIRYSRPSIDLTFSSVADAFGEAAIGAVLTGANADGAEGLRRIADRGGVAIVQDPATAESPTMPAAALKSVPGARVLTLGAIGALIGELARSPVRSAALARSKRPPEARP